MDEAFDTYKRLFTFPRMIEDLVCGFLARGERARLGVQLDFPNMTQVPDGWVVGKWRCAQVVWSIPVRPEMQAEVGAGHMILLLRLQSKNNPEIGRRLDQHRERLHRECNRREAFGAPDHPPVLVPVVIYNGAEPWSAPENQYFRI